LLGKRTSVDVSQRKKSWQREKEKRSLRSGGHVSRENKRESSAKKKEGASKEKST